MNEKKVELLAPAGSHESFIAAVNAGADAVYIGGSRFGARANADNLDEEAMLKAIDYAHLHGCSLYLTVNTLLKNSELEKELFIYLKKFYEQGLDAVIVQDIGVLRAVRKWFPDLPVHASTQMTITGADGAKLMEELGLTRIVTSRELSLEEIKDIHERTNVEIESFVHGALCYCYSGQCLYSSLIGGRSGNRGRCAQPCRLPYDVMRDRKKLNKADETYVLSPKDMCTLDLIPDLIEAGVYSFKIEGRMKKPEYTAGVVSIYRKYIDLYLEKGRKSYRVSDEDRNMLMDLYNRGGFTSGYYRQHNGRQMISLSRPNHFGVPIGTVAGKSKGRLKIKVTLPINSQDVLEIQKNAEADKNRPSGKGKDRGQNLQNRPSYENKSGTEFTVKNDVAAGSELYIPVPDEREYSVSQTVYRTRNDSLLRMLRSSYVEQEAKEIISGRLILKPGEPSKLSVSAGSISVSAEGTVVETTLSQLADPGKIRRQIMKTGNTPFSFGTLELDIDEKSFMPIQALNELRRTALETLAGEILKKYRRQPADEAGTARLALEPVAASASDMPSFAPGMELNAYIEQESYLYELSDLSEISNFYIDSLIICQDINKVSIRISAEKLRELAEFCHRSNKGCYLVFPHIFRKEIRELYAEIISDINESGIDGAVIKNLEEFAFLRECGFDKPIVADHTIYTFNKEALEFWDKSGIAHDTAPIELNSRELKERGCENSELIVYGYLPMMVSAQCIKKTLSGCDRTPETLYLKDRYQKEFCVKNQCAYCYNTIYNCQPLVLLDNDKEIRNLHPKALRLNFTIEPAGQVHDIAKAFIDRFIYNRNPLAKFDSFTRGHFKRGVE